MSSRNFEEWLQTFRNSISGYGYYVNFKTVYKNIELLKVEVNILNSLIGSKHIESDFDNLIERYPECLKVIPILLAVRKNELYCQDEFGAVNYYFNKKAQTAEQYKYFMQKTGLFDLLQNHIISNLYDYVTGVEVGMSSNGRKNRGGDQMEDLVEVFLKRECVEYYKEMYLADIEKKWNIDLSTISAGGTSTKRWDFVVKTPNRIFVIETNFYTNSGSKLNETARSYKMIAEEAKSIEGFSFIWITDGDGWKKAKRNLKETFDVLETLYNISDMENGALKLLFDK